MYRELIATITTDTLLHNNEINCLLHNAILPGNSEVPRDYLESVDDAIWLVKTALPGFMYRIMDCSVSSDAWVLPDFNHPIHGERLRKQFPEAMKSRDPADWFQNDVDMRPADQPATALVVSLLITLEKIANIEQSPP